MRLAGIAAAVPATVAVLNADRGVPLPAVVLRGGAVMTFFESASSSDVIRCGGGTTAPGSSVRRLTIAPRPGTPVAVLRRAIRSGGTP